MQSQGTNAKPKNYYTPDEVCELLPVGRTQIYKMLKSGEIPRMRLGKKYLVPCAAFNEWIASCGKANPTKPSVWEDPKHAAR